MCIALLKDNEPETKHEKNNRVMKEKLAKQLLDEDDCDHEERDPECAFCISKNLLGL